MKTEDAPRTAQPPRTPTSPNATPLAAAPDPVRHGDAAPAERPLPNSITYRLAVACGVSVANVYYAQPLLDAMAAEFHLDQAWAGGIVTATQLGCALALLLVVPLGDRLGRRTLLAAQAALLVLSAIGVALASSRIALFAGMVSLGLWGTAMTQGIIALAATLAAPSQRGHVVGTTQAGVVIGLLMTRAMAGLLADIGGWRLVYGVSAVMVLAVGALVWRTLPALPAPTQRPAWSSLLRAPFVLIWQEPVLRVRGTLGLLSFASLSAFWSTLVLPLSAPPFSMPHTWIGAFGFVGAIGAVAAARTGRLADRGYAQRTTGAALMLMLTSWGALAMLPHSMAIFVVGVIVLDLAAQAVHVLNQSLIFSVRPDAQSRLVSAYMLFYAVGSGAGALAATNAFARWGWGGTCAVGAAISAIALMFWALTCPRKMPYEATCRPTENV